MRFLLSLGVSLSGGLIFTFLHIPISWLLGPMLFMLLGSQVFKLQLMWPTPVRDYGILIIGYAIGLTMTEEALQGILFQLPMMLLMSLLLVGLCALIAYAASKATDFDFPSLLVGSVPGGLSQMVTLADEMKPINLTLVTFLQVIRLIMIVFCVPILLYSPWIGGNFHASGIAAEAQDIGPSWSGLFPDMLFYAPLCILGAWIARKLHFPTASMLGPMLVMGIVQWTAAAPPPELPVTLLNISQLMIGSHVGLMLRPQQLQRKKQTITLALLSSMLLITGSVGLSYFLSKVFSLSAATSLLSMAPGGMDQMSIMAHAIGADLSIVSGYQLFRILFIFFVVSPLLKMILTRMLKRSPDRQPALPSTARPKT
ncbi:AbrB family transcriptional regulator [Paenibacillus sp. N4]|uniref:AbrB family transcriptional regulator n=1 Tax=Paenibacillus vietnamensis TaxID=2590547 RepID=UPI001CD086FB|nr:AbrB family transcriptional regulator [Paenibacillus vietnamensis]MCA0755811.1 AbrB family transcriptional regulator [Paenibacillus vietnamensis]